MATADDLPDDVLHNIFDLMFNQSKQTDSLSLSRASRVCRRWRVPAQRALAMNISSLSFIDSGQAERWVNSPLRSRYQI